MAAPSTEEIAQVQAKILEIGTRLQSDATFKTLFAAGPVATLKAQGLPDAAIQEIKAQATRARSRFRCGRLPRPSAPMDCHIHGREDNPPAKATDQREALRPEFELQPLEKERKVPQQNTMDAADWVDRPQLDRSYGGICDRHPLCED